MLRVLTFPLAIACVSVAVSQTLPNHPGLTLDEDSAWVVNTTRVSRQLQLESNQQQKISSVFESYTRTQQSLFAKSAPTQKQLDVLDRQLASNVLGTLTPKQRERLHQVALQLAGPFSLADQSVSTEVGLTEAQRAKVKGFIAAAKRRQNAFDDSQTAIMTAHPNAGPSEQTQLLSALAPKRRALKLQQRLDEQKVLGMLNQAQMKKWTAMLGPRMP